MSAPARLFEDPVSDLDSPASIPAVPRRVRLGMPHLDVGGLSEGWLLRHAGDLHWEAVARRLGVPTDDIRDEAHDRIYPTVVALRARYGAPLSCVHENDVLDAAVEVMPCGRACAEGRITAVAGRTALSIELVTTFARRDPGRSPGHPLDASQSPLEPRPAGARGTPRRAARRSLRRADPGRQRRPARRSPPRSLAVRRL